MASSVTGWGLGLTTLGFTCAAVVTHEEANAASFYTAHVLQSGTAARQIGMGFNGSSLLTLLIGAAEITFAGTTPTLGNWYLYVITKATGTVTPLGYRLDMTTGVWSGAISGSATSANRTAGVCTANVGSFSTGDYWDGRIARVAIFEKVLNAGEALELRFPMSWRRHSVGHNGLYVDLGWRQNVFGLDEVNRAVNFGTGTAPAVVGTSPPGW